jgi:hypothetical protein
MDLHNWLCIICAIDCTRNSLNRQFLPFSVMLCTESFSFWNVFRASYNYDSKYFTTELTRKRDWSIFFLHYTCANYFSCNIRSNCKFSRLFDQSDTLWTSYYNLRITKLFRIRSLLDESW